MVFPFHGTSDRISLSIQKHSHGTRASEASDQKLVLAWYHDDIGVWHEVEFGRLDLRYRQDFRHGSLGQVYKTVGIGRWYRSTEIR